MADWISSSTDYFPVTETSDRNFRYLERVGGQEARLNQALDALELPSTWRPRRADGDVTDLLRTRLGVPFEARPLQEAAVEAAQSLSGPGMLIIEDAMGSGKTEAALLAAEVLAWRFGANGLLIAMPTQATTDAMFTRMLRFLRVDAEASLAECAAGPASVALLHGRADWNQEASDLKRAGRAFLDNIAQPFEVELGSGQIEVETAQTNHPKFLTHPWLRGRSKAILSSFVATTVDHLLMGALQMKHLALRHLGLSSKVIIFDEVHASSRFMNFFAERILQWLGSYQVPVIMLSATLDSGLRDRLGSAYQNGLQSTVGGQPSEGLVANTQSAKVSGDDNGDDNGDDTADDSAAADFAGFYPRLTMVERERTVATRVSPATEPRQVKVKAAEPGETAASVVKKLAGKRQGNILVLVNTVSRAQQTYAELSESFGAAVRLVHARFTAANRMENDQWLLDTYGPNAKDRPRFSIVVATQVVEQSLDVDFDVLVTDVAPIDLLLQRIGRVHRHTTPRPQRFNSAVCHLVGVPFFDSAPDLSEGALGSACRIYSQKPVLAGLLALGKPLQTPDGRAVILPQEIGELVERAAQGAFETPTKWVKTMQVAEAKWQGEEEEAAAQIAETRLAPPDRKRGPFATLHDLYGATTETGDGPARVARGKVRDGLEGLDVILVQRKGDDVYTMPSSANPAGVRLPLDVAPDGWVAREALLGTVALPAWAVRNTDEVLTELEQGCWGPGLEDSYLLGGELLLPLENGEAELGGYRYRYTREKGLEVQRGT